MTIEVSKRTGANLIETVDGVKAAVEKLKATWPGTVHVAFTQDKSKVIRTMLSDLQNSVAMSVLLVAVIILFALGFRASFFIGIAIPASFLAGVLGLQLAGLTVNIVVLFSLILAVGMLVDDAIIVSEFAERRMSEGMPPPQAYSLAAKRMSGPVIAATATRDRRLLATAVLAGRGRRIHEVYADHLDRDAVGDRWWSRWSSRRHSARCSAKPRRSRMTSASPTRASTCARCAPSVRHPGTTWPPR